MQLRNLDEMVAVLAVIALLSGCSTIGRPVPIAGLVSDNGPDAEVRDFPDRSPDRQGSAHAVGR
jgi:hypothetical protein